MGKYIILFACLLLTNISNAQLKKANEVIIHAFKTTGNKWVYICKEKKDNYIVYRFGTDTEIELQYPAKLDSASWQQFSFRSYMRGGGVENAGMEFQNLDFTNDSISYSVYNNWDATTGKYTCSLYVYLP